MTGTQGKPECMLDTCSLAGKPPNSETQAAAALRVEMSLQISHEADHLTGHRLRIIHSRRRHDCMPPCSAVYECTPATDDHGP